MNKKALILTATAFALCACKTPYSDWEMPNVVRNNKPQHVKKAQTPSASSQVQPKFEQHKAPTPAPAQQIQPEFKKPEPAPAPKPEQQIQPQLKKPEPAATPAPKPEQQIQPQLKKPEPAAAPAPEPEQPVTVSAPEPVAVTTPAPKPETKKISIAETALPNTQVQPTFKQPKQQSSSPRPVMTKAQKEQFPVMPGQNRALKRRR